MAHCSLQQDMVALKQDPQQQSKQPHDSPAQHSTALTLLRFASPELTKSSRRPGVAMISCGPCCSCLPCCDLLAPPYRHLRGQQNSRSGSSQQNTSTKDTSWCAILERPANVLLSKEHAKIGLYAVDQEDAVRWSGQHANIQAYCCQCAPHRSQLLL